MNPLTIVSSKVLCRTIGGVLDVAKGSFPAVVRLETTKILTVSHTPTGKPLRRHPLRTSQHKSVDVGRTGAAFSDVFDGFV